ncbi:tail fiber assembly protein [Escherichia coli]
MNQLYYFSASNNGFYAQSLKDSVYEPAGAWPADAVEMSDDDYKTYSGQAPEGKILGSGDGGVPAWVDIPPPTREESIAAAEQKKTELLKTAQDTIINWQSKLLLGIISDEDKASLIKWLAYIDALNAVDTANPNWPDPPSV